MAEITQKQGTWTFDEETLRLVPGSGRGVHQLRTTMGELTIPLEALHSVALEPGKRRSRLRLRMRAGADPFTQSSRDGLPPAADPYVLEVERDRGGAAEYLADAVRAALLVEQIPVDTPTDRYLLTGPPVPCVLHGSDGTMTFDGEQFRTEWGTAAEEVKKSSGPRTLSLGELQGVEWSRPTWSTGWLRLVPKGAHPALKPTHDPNCVVMWGFREAKETAQGALLAAAVTARLPHPFAGTGSSMPATALPAGHGPAQAADSEPQDAVPADAIPPDAAAPLAKDRQPGGDDHDALLRRLRELGALWSTGVLTKEEFERAKAALLDRF